MLILAGNIVPSSLGVSYRRVMLCVEPTCVCIASVESVVVYKQSAWK
jgi:hypothetical protein